MEISNKTFGVICVAVCVVVVYVRAQSIHPAPTAPPPAPEVVAVTEKAPKVRHRIPDSPLPPGMTNDATSDDEPIVLAGDITPVADPVKASVPPSAPPVASAPPSAAPNSVDESLTYQDDLEDLVPEPQANNTMQLSDRDVLRIMLGTLNQQQRAEFQTLWYTMSPDERQNLIDEVRGSQQGG